MCRDDLRNLRTTGTAVGSSLEPRADGIDAQTSTLDCIADRVRAYAEAGAYRGTRINAVQALAEQDAASIGRCKRATA